MTADEAWRALPKYEYGQDMAALLAIDRAVIEAMATPDTRAKCAARLADLLAAKQTTPAAGSTSVCNSARSARPRKYPCWPRCS